MPTKISHTVTAPKRQALTLDEIAGFVADARTAGVPGNAVPVAKIRMSGKVSALTVDSDSAPTASAEADGQQW